MKRIVILGGGFGGIYTAMYLEKKLKKELKAKEIELSLISREDYFTYQPILSEVIRGSVGLFDTVSPIRRLLSYTHLFIREIEKIDLEHKQIILAPQFSHTPKICPFDTLVISLGNVTDFRDNPGLHEHALAFKNLGDAISIRNRVISAIEAAAIEDNEQLRKQLLTFVIAGGGFSGTEVAAEVDDFARKLCLEHPQLSREKVRTILIHAGERLLDREMDASLGNFAGNLLKKRGIELIFNKKLVSASPDEALLDDGTKIATQTIISSAPSNSNPLIDDLSLPKTKGKINTTPFLQIEGREDLWALGDCAHVPVAGGFSPPTAQHATRQAKQLAYNLAAKIQGNSMQPFHFKALGMLGALGHHSAVAELFGKLKFSGFFAWMLWRFVYWLKLPGFDRKLKTAVSWLLDMIVPVDSVQLKTGTSQGITPLHFETGQIVFHEGDVGDYLYIITDGEVEVFNKQEHLAILKQGEYFGEMALLNQKLRSATVRAIKPTNVLALGKRDFGVLISNFKELKTNFEQTEKMRRNRTKKESA